MNSKIIALALLIGMASCTKYENNVNGPNDVRSLPSLHLGISQTSTDYFFPAPTSYESWDATTDCHYVQGNLKLDVTIGLDGKIYTLPQGTYNGVTFVIKLPSAVSEAAMVFPATGQYYTVVWEMVP